MAYMDTFVRRDPGDQSARPMAMNPRIKIKTSEGEEKQLQPIDPFAEENPGWDPLWVKAYKVNFMGKVINVVVFLIFNIIFWGIALSHYYAEVDILEVKPPQMA